MRRIKVDDLSCLPGYDILLNILTDYRLLKVPDPRQFGLPRPDEYSQFQMLRLNLGLNMAEGHYILVQVQGTYYEGYKQRDSKWLFC